MAAGETRSRPQHRRRPQHDTTSRRSHTTSRRNPVDCHVYDQFSVEKLVLRRLFGRISDRSSRRHEVFMPEFSTAYQGI